MMNLYDEVKSAKTIAIAGHIKPDGDCVGSVMAIYLYLKKRMPDSVIIPMIEKPGEVFDFLPHLDEINNDFNPSVDVFDVFIGTDCSSIDRFGEAQKFYHSAKKRVIIDHHVPSGDFNDTQYIVSGASSACELVYDVIDEGYIDNEIATFLYLGILTDTGIFRFMSTTPKTMMVVSKMMEFDFDFTNMIEDMYFTRTWKQITMCSVAANLAHKYDDCKTIISIVDQKIMKENDADIEDLETVLDFIRETKGYEIAVFVYEKNPGEFKVSMRSKNNTDVAQICLENGGGGHVRAAGFTYIKENHEGLEELIIEAIRKQV